MLDAALAAIEIWEPVVVFRRSVWAYPIVSWAHLIGIGLLLGTIIAIDLALLGASRRLGADLARRALLPLTLCGFAIAVVSGVLLFLPAGREYLANPYFGLKLAMIAAAGANALTLKFVARRNRSAEPTIGAVSLILWLGTIFAGRMLAFG